MEQKSNTSTKIQGANMKLSICVVYILVIVIIVS